MATNDVVSLYKQLKKEWSKTPRDLKKCGELLDQLKVSWINFLFTIWSNLNGEKLKTEVKVRLYSV